MCHHVRSSNPLSHKARIYIHEGRATLSDFHYRERVLVSDQNELFSSCWRVCATTEPQITTNTKRVRFFFIFGIIYNAPIINYA